MAPGLRSGRTGHSRAAGAGGGEEAGGCPVISRDSGGEGRCLRGRWRAGASGMLAKCVLSAGMLSLLVRCALAAEERNTYDASGSSSLQTDLAATAAPARPLAGLSVAEVVPFSDVHSNGDSQAEVEGLSGKPAFSSVLTVIAGTVRHPVSLDQGRTLPTITKDETHTTQWPSQSSSYGSKMSSSSAGERIPPASSGLAPNFHHQHTTPTRAPTMPLTVSSSSSSSTSASLLSNSPHLSSVVSQNSFQPSAAFVNKAASPPQSEKNESSLAPLQNTSILSTAGSPDWTDILKTSRPTHWVVDLTAVTERLQTTANKSLFPREASTEKANSVAELTSFSPVDKIHKLSGTRIEDAESTNAITAPATSTRTLNSTPHHQQNLLHRPTQTQNLGMNSVSSNNHLISTSVPTNHEETQAVQRQQEALQNPTSALLSAHPNSYSLSSHAAQQMLNGTAYADSQTSAHKGAGDATTWRVNPRVVNPTSSPAVMLTTAGSFFTSLGGTSLSETATAKPTPFHSGSVSSVHTSNLGDLPVAASRGSPGAGAIDMSYSREATVESELTSVSAHAHPNKLLSRSQLTWESSTGSVLSSITRTDTTISTSESPHLLINGVVKESLTQIGTTESIAEDPTSLSRPKMSISSDTGSLSPDSTLSVRLAQDTSISASHERLSNPSGPTSASPLFISRSPNHNYTLNNVELSANTEVHFANQVKASMSSKINPSQRHTQTSLLKLPLKFYTASGPDTFPHKSPRSVSSADIPTLIKSEVAAQSLLSTFKLETTAGSELIPGSDVRMASEKMPTETLHRNAENISLSPFHGVREESTLIRNTALNKRGVPSGHSTSEFPSFMTAKHVFVLDRVSEGSGKGSSSVNPWTPIPFDGALETLSRKDDVTLVGHYEQPSASSWSEMIPVQRTNSTSRSSDLIASAKKSNFYFGTQSTVPLPAFSATPTSPVDQQKSSETFRAIFSTGTNVTAQHTEWKSTNPVPFTSSVPELENRSAGFDRANSISRADGSSYTQPELEGGQEHNVPILYSSDPTLANGNSYSVHPTAGKHPSFTTFVEETSWNKDQSLNLSPANLRSPVFVAPSAQGSDGPLPLSHTPTGSVSPSQASPPTPVHKSEHTPSLADADSFISVSDTAVTLSNNAAPRFSDTNHISDPVTRGLTLPPELASSFSSSLSAPQSSWPSLPSFSGVSDLSTSHFKPISVMSYKASSSSASLSSTSRSGASLAVRPSMYPVDTASASSLSVRAAPAVSSSSRSNPDMSIDSKEVTKTSVVLTETGTDDITAGTSNAGALTFPKEKVASLAPSQSVRITLSAGATERTSQVSPLPPQQDTTTASVELTATTFASTTKTPNPTIATSSIRTPQSTTTPQPTAVTWRRTTTTTMRTQTSRRIFTPLVPRTSPPRASTPIFISPFTTTTETPPQQCNITERLWVKTVVSIYVRRNRLDSIQRQNLRRGLSQGLRKALNDSAAQAQVETVFGSPNMTVAYHVTGRDTVYPPSVVLEGLESYGRDKLIADLRQYLPMVTALPLPVAPWRARPATSFQLKTVLQFVGAGDDPRSCRFSQMMEQRLEKVFAEAQAKVFNTNSRLSVQMLSVSQAASSPAVSLVYSVRNGTVFLNGTIASNLLGQLSAELVGYFLFYPPLVIAEPMEYHNLNTSVATRDFWVITVIQDVDDSSLEGQYQSFASLMEQRLAELFVLAGQQGTRFRRAAAVGSYTVQMVSIRRVTGSRNPAEMTYYVQHNGVPLSGTSAAKVLNTVDSQTMALTLGYFVQLQAEPVVKSPPNNLWIIAAVLAPIAVVTLIIIIITAVLCRKNKNDFKADAIGNLNPRAKMAYRRDMGYYHQPVQGFDYAKQHLGQQGGDEETLPASQDTLMMSLQIRDTPLSLEKTLQQDGTANRKSLTSDKHKSKLPSEDGSVISNESEKLRSGRGLTVLKVTAQQKVTKEETHKKDDPYETSSGSLQLISIKPMAAQPNYSHPASSDRSQDSAIVNGEVNLALKQKSDIEHYRNKLRLKAKRKGYYDFPSADGGSSGGGGGGALVQRHPSGQERSAGELGRPLEPDDERGSTYVKSHRRHSQVGQMAYRSRQSLSSPSPGGTEMDLLVMRERPRRGIRNSGYDTEPELIEETNVDRLMGSRRYMYGRGLKGHSETSSLSSQPSIDEVRQQMHLLLEEAFSLASGGQSTSGRHSHHHHHPPPDHYSHAPPPLPYSDMVTSAPGTMSCGRGGLPWVPSYSADVFQCSLPKPAFHFTQLPEIAMGSPPPLPPRTGPPPGTALRRSTSDLGPKGRSSEASVAEMQSHRDANPCGPNSRAVVPSISAEQPLSNYSGNPITAVYAIPATRPGYSEYFVSSPSTSYHSPSWMSFPPEPDELPPQWADSLPLPGYVEAFPHPRYPLGSPTRLPLQYSQALEPPPPTPDTASQQSLPQVVKDMDSMPLSSLSTSALVQAIRQEVAKLAKKQNDVFEF